MNSTETYNLPNTRNLRGTQTTELQRLIVSEYMHVRLLDLHTAVYLELNQFPTLYCIHPHF